jgi:DNA repair exonuclease SbcCD ATPase subunit
MNRLAALIRSLPEEELILIKRDIDEGNLSRVVQERLAELDVPQHICPVCNTPLEDDAPYLLYFGNLVRKKARFDAKDCLRTFLDEMDEKKERKKADS